MDCVLQLYSLNQRPMSVQPRKKSIMDVPFTQLWHNYARQADKENQIRQKIRRPSKQLTSHADAKKPHACQTPRLSQHRLSWHKGAADSLEPEHCNSSLQEVNRANPNGPSGERGSLSRGGTGFANSSMCELERPDSCTGAGRRKDAVAERVLKIIEVNVIPFMVDKFLEIEDKVDKRIVSLQSVVELQNKELAYLREREQSLSQSLESLAMALSTQKEQSEQHRKKPTKPVQMQLAKDSFVYDKIRELALSQGRCLSTMARYQQEQEKLREMIRTMSSAVDQFQGRTENCIESINARVAKVGQKLQGQEQKLDKQFAERMLQLISTYNDNFVDLDKRVAELEASFSLGKSRVVEGSPSSRAFPRKCNK